MPRARPEARVPYRPRSGASILSKPYFRSEAAAYEFLESELWPSGPVCPHCRSTDRIGKMRGESTRAGVYKCYVCRKPFTVKIGTIFESSHVALHLWLQAIFLIASSRKGISTSRLHRTLGVTPKTALFMSHRIREAMRRRQRQLARERRARHLLDLREQFQGRRKITPLRRRQPIR